jgi:hypothetical protein
MINTSGTEARPRRGEAGKSLKDQNRWQLAIVIVANSLFLYGVIQAHAIRTNGLRAVLTDAQNLLPVGVALVLTTVLNGLLSADTKARLVFLRWRHTLPGHRAFSKYALGDPRIDLPNLETLHGSPLPSDPLEQNHAWYLIYRTIENDPAVRQVHRSFLLLRDYTGLCVMFLVCYGPLGLYAISSPRIAWTYLLVLALQFALVRQAAANYGIGMVTTVLARWASRERPHAPEPTRNRTHGKADK